MPEDVGHLQGEAVHCGNREMPPRIYWNWRDAVEGLIALSFHDSRRAAQAFNLLWQMNNKLVIELDDAVIVHRNPEGDLEYDQDFISTLNRKLCRFGLWGGLLGMSLLYHSPSS